MKSDDPEESAERGERNERAALTALMKRVRAAFAVVPYPGDDNIASAGALEPAAIAADLRGKDWRDLKGVDFDYGSAPSFLTPEAFRYYLPALLLNLLEDYDSPTYFDSLAGSTLTSLEPPPYRLGTAVLSAALSTALEAALGTEIWAGLDAYFASRVALLSREQRAAVRDVLRYDAARNRVGLEEDQARIEQRAEGDPVRQDLWEWLQYEKDQQAKTLAFWERAAEEAADGPCTAPTARDS
jgi:hypothetical protein